MRITRLAAGFSQNEADEAGRWDFGCSALLELILLQVGAIPRVLVYNLNNFNATRSSPTSGKKDDHITFSGHGMAEGKRNRAGGQPSMMRGRGIVYSYFEPSPFSTSSPALGTIFGVVTRSFLLAHARKEERGDLYERVRSTSASPENQSLIWIYPSLGSTEYLTRHAKSSKVGVTTSNYRLRVLLCTPRLLYQRDSGKQYVICGNKLRGLCSG